MKASGAWSEPRGTRIKQSLRSDPVVSYSREIGSVGLQIGQRATRFNVIKSLASQITFQAQAPATLAPERRGTSAPAAVLHVPLNEDLMILLEGNERDLSAPTFVGHSGDITGLEAASPGRHLLRTRLDRLANLVAPHIDIRPNLTTRRDALHIEFSGIDVSQLSAILQQAGLSGIWYTLGSASTDL